MLGLGAEGSETRAEMAAPRRLGASEGGRDPAAPRVGPEVGAR